MSRFMDPLLPPARPEVARVLDQIAAASADLAKKIARGGLDENLAAGAGTNSDGDAQKALDVIADASFREALGAGDVRFFASEEQEDAIELSPGGELALAIDPLDGSSNIETNVSVGSIFAIHEAKASAQESLLRPGREMLAAGYVIYGPQCCMMVSTGNGVLKYLLDPATGRFRLLGQVAPIPPESTEYAINASNYRHWPNPVRAYIDDRIAGAEGPMDVDFNMRWIASLVAETHRILTRGGIFLYPSDARKGYERGRLRMLYECAPIAFLVEQAGGAATDGIDAILDLAPDSLHARTPFVFGSASKVARVRTYHDLPEKEQSPLFGRRGLFRSNDA